MTENKIRLTVPVLPGIEEYIGYLKKIWSSKCLTNNGEFVQSLEVKLREYLGIENLALVSNGTLALHLALKALGLKGEVITTPFTFAATTNVILWEGLTPVFSDIDSQTFNINPDDIKKRITSKTSAILAVHTYGNPCYAKELQEIAEKHNLKLIFDAAHAFGVQYANQSVLNFGDISTLSFHATKVYTTIEGGAVVCKDEKIMEKIKLLRNHGIRSQEEILIPGTNAKMDEFRAAMGLCNLKRIDENIRQRKIIYNYYKRKLAGSVQFQRLTATRYNYNYMPVCFKDAVQRDTAYSGLVRNGIEPRKYFFPLTTNFDYFSKANTAKQLKLEEAFDVSSRAMCLPLYPGLKIESVDNIVAIIRSLVQRKK